MIRKLQKVDINKVADIWLKINLKAHFFVPEQYWISNYEFIIQCEQLDKSTGKKEYVMNWKSNIAR